MMQHSDSKVFPSVMRPRLSNQQENHATLRKRYLHTNNTMAVLLKTASVRVSSIQIMQIRVQNKGKSVWKSIYDGDVSGDYCSFSVLNSVTPVCHFRSNRMISMQPKNATRCHRFPCREDNLPLVPTFCSSSTR